jgi:hypothetical protein
MCAPAQLINSSDDQVLELANTCLAELQRRHRPTPDHQHLLAAVRGAIDQLAQVERFHQLLLLNRTAPAAAAAAVPRFLRRQPDPDADAWDDEIR